MPELPEVEVVRRRLAPDVVGARVVACETLHDQFAHDVGGRRVATFPVGRVARLDRQGKWLLWVIVRPAGDVVGVATNLGMSGRFSVSGVGGRIPKHARFTVDLATERGPLTVRYSDPRCMGRVRLLRPATVRELVSARRSEVGLPLEDWGVDAASPVFTRDERRGAQILTEAFDTRTPVKQALMDQSRLCGIGNIYANELCWRVGVHPMAPASDLTWWHWLAVTRRMPEMLSVAIASGGTSFGDANSYRDPSGREGEYSKYLAVYGREGAWCPTCATPIVRINQVGRGTFFCPACQRQGNPHEQESKARRSPEQSGRRDATRERERPRPVRRRLA